MHRSMMFALAAILSTFVSAPASAQRLTFERTFELSAPPILDVSTVRGTIGASVGDPGPVVITSPSKPLTGAARPV